MVDWIFKRVCGEVIPEYTPKVRQTNDPVILYYGLANIHVK